MEILEHFGVYGVCIRDDRLLCIKKCGGPYNGRYDLPGGSRKNGESLLDTLNREFTEETSYKIIEIYKNKLFDTFVKINEKQQVHHIFGIYDVELEKVSNSKEVGRYINYGEVNDSLGEEWVDIKELTEKNSSPLILKVLTTQREFQAKKYDKWQIL
jgi:ADP-ribose pyrophosphatase YjhB (NUDIX family)